MKNIYQSKKVMISIKPNGAITSPATPNPKDNCPVQAAHRTERTKASMSSKQLKRTVGKT